MYTPPYLPVPVGRWTRDRAEVECAEIISRICSTAAHRVPLASARTAAAMVLAALERALPVERIDLGELLEA